MRISPGSAEDLAAVALCSTIEHLRSTLIALCTISPKLRHFLAQVRDDTTTTVQFIDSRSAPMTRELAPIIRELSKDSLVRLADKWMKSPSFCSEEFSKFSTYIKMRPVTSDDISRTFQDAANQLSLALPRSALSHPYTHSRHPAACSSEEEATVLKLPAELWREVIVTESLELNDINNCRLLCRQLSLYTTSLWKDRVNKRQVSMKLDSGFPQSALLLAEHAVFQNTVTRVILVVPPPFQGSRTRPGLEAVDRERYDGFHQRQHFHRAIATLFRLLILSRIYVQYDGEPSVSIRNGIRVVGSHFYSTRGDILGIIEDVFALGLHEGLVGF
ncbi:hypothetical protein HBI67_160420 [Parastagonospora nodorum]|nr:hypothetical protein HBI66_199830 [Parastagonospora nodorum]KAH6060098.1 hypothetical protein HBI67_160420 [Parastagonospora nodorum]